MFIVRVRCFTEVEPVATGLGPKFIVLVREVGGCSVVCCPIDAVVCLW